MISVRYALEHPDFKPTQSVARSAGYDLRAYLADTRPLNWSEFTHSEVSGTFVNGQPVDYTRLTNEKLNEHDPLRRFVILRPGERTIVSAGFKLGLSTDTPGKIATMLICARSGLACKTGVTVINSPGIVDEQYPHTVGIGLVNMSNALHLFSHGSRVAQAIFCEVDEVDEFIVEQVDPEGDRIGGFGSTGV
jgi:dUTP pyrophosphatase